MSTLCHVMLPMCQPCLISLILLGSIPAIVRADLDSRTAHAHEAFLADRRAAFTQLRDPFGVPPKAVRVPEIELNRNQTGATWRGNVVAQVFWVGQKSAEKPHEARPNAWNPHWVEHFGGIDHPQRRNGYLPADFTPRRNPFYVALPFNDLGPDQRHRPEASEVIPWYWREYRGNNHSVCKGRWLAIHHRGKICYAQWENVGPDHDDLSEYVFGGHPLPDNLKGHAGIEISPATRDFLKFRHGDRIQWRFVRAEDVPRGPWNQWKKASASQ